MERIVEMISQSTRHLGDRVAAEMPAALVALAILVGGWVVALLMGIVVRRLVHRIQRRLPTAASQGTSAEESRRTARTLATVARWFTMVFFVMVAAETVGLGAVASWLAQLTTYLPRALVALVIGFAGIVLGRLARVAATRAATAAGLPHSQQIGRGLQVALLVAVGLVAVDQLGVEVGFLVTAIEIVLAALLGGAALAFGLGARVTIENVLASHYVRKSYDVGDRVRLEGVEGRIVQLGTTNVILDATGGETTIPARDFATSRCVRVGGESGR